MSDQCEFKDEGGIRCKGFMTELEFNTDSYSTVEVKQYCSNALCSVNKRFTRAKSVLQTNQLLEIRI